VAKVVRVAEQRKNARLRRRKPVAVPVAVPAPVATEGTEGTEDNEVNALLAELQGSSLIGGYLRSMPSLTARPLAVSGIGGASIGGAILSRAQMLAEMKSWPQPKR